MDGKGAYYVRRVIFAGNMGDHESQIVDMDGDVDIDIIFREHDPKSYNAVGDKKHIEWMENVTVPTTNLFLKNSPNKRTLDLVQEYDPVKEAWNTRTAMPTKREHAAVAVLDSLIYVVSGRVGNASMGKLEAFSPASGKRHTFKDMPTVRCDIGFALSQSKLYTMRGEKPGIFDVNQEYDPAADSWKFTLRMTGMRKAVSTATFENTVFVFGGFSSSGLINTVEAFVPPGGISTVIATEKRSIGIRPRDVDAALTGMAKDALGRTGRFAPADCHSGKINFMFARWFGAKFSLRTPFSSQETTRCSAPIRLRWTLTEMNGRTMEGRGLAALSGAGYSHMGSTLGGRAAPGS